MVRASLERAGWDAHGCRRAVLCQAGWAGEGLKLQGTWSRAEGPQAAKGVFKGRVSMGTMLEPLQPHWVAQLLHQRGEGPCPQRQTGADRLGGTVLCGAEHPGVAIPRMDGVPRMDAVPGHRNAGSSRAMAWGLLPAVQERGGPRWPGGDRAVCVQGVPAGMEQGRAWGGVTQARGERRCVACGAHVLVGRWRVCVGARRGGSWREAERRWRACRRDETGCVGWALVRQGLTGWRAGAGSPLGPGHGGAQPRLGSSCHSERANSFVRVCWEGGARGSVWRRPAQDGGRAAVLV